MTVWGRAWRAAVRGTGTALGWLVLAPIHWLLFIPARGWLALRGRDPLRRRFPAPEASRWEPPS